jgi:hypothetical protein
MAACALNTLHVGQISHFPAPDAREKCQFDRKVGQEAFGWPVAEGYAEIVRTSLSDASGRGPEEGSDEPVIEFVGVDSDGTAGA